MLSSQIQPHLKHIPDYLLPTKLRKLDENGEAKTGGFVPFKRKRKGGKGGDSRKRPARDPLRAIKVKRQ